MQMVKATKIYFILISFLAQPAIVESGLASSGAQFVPLIELDKDAYALERIGASLIYEGEPFSGYLVRYYANGQLMERTAYLNGLREGQALKFYPDGRLKEERWYRKNQKHGHHRGFWPDGKPQFDMFFEHGLTEGELKEWYANGQLFMVFHYEQGKEKGSQKMWKEGGGIRANYVVKNGRRFGLIGLKNCKSVSDETGIYARMAY